ncbi:MAG: META domain-containing protein [Hyphomicrobiaceae bacterium]
MRRVPNFRDLIAVAMLMCAGASAGVAQATTPVQLTGSEWVVESVGGAAASGDRRARIGFAADGRVTGSGGCNRLMGRADINDQGITFGTMATTRMACAPKVMEQERKLLDALAATRSYRIADAVLTLHDASGAEIVRLIRKS